MLINNDYEVRTIERLQRDSDPLSFNVKFGACL